MISFRSFLLLLLFRRVQVDSYHSFFVDFDSLTVCTVASVGDPARRIKNIRFFKRRLRPEIEQLCDAGYISPTNHPDSYRLKEAGWTFISVSVQNLLKLLLNSVVFPALVAFITTLLTLWVQGLGFFN